MFCNGRHAKGWNLAKCIVNVGIAGCAAMRLAIAFWRQPLNPHWSGQHGRGWMGGGSPCAKRGGAWRTACNAVGPHVAARDHLFCKHGGQSAADPEHEGARDAAPELRLSPCSHSVGWFAAALAVLALRWWPVSGLPCCVGRRQRAAAVAHDAPLANSGKPHEPLNSSGGAVPSIRQFCHVITVSVPPMWCSLTGAWNPARDSMQLTDASAIRRKSTPNIWATQPAESPRRQWATTDTFASESFSPWLCEASA